MSSIATVGLAVVGLCTMAILVIVMRAVPRATFLLWAVVMFFVPIWVGVEVRHIFLPAITVVTVLALVALGGDLQPAVPDLFVAILVLLVLAQYVLGLVEISYAVTTVLEWTIPYIWGRLVISRVPGRFIIDSLALCAVVAAAMAVVEFITKVNVFDLIRLNNSLHNTWSSLQYRDGVLRVEGAWGHSIALGAALAMSSGFILAARWRPLLRILCLVVVAAATTLTISRIGLLILLLVIVLTIVLLPGIGRGLRVTVGALCAVGAAVIVPIIFGVLSRAGDEAAGSADYRGSLFLLFRYVKLFGSAPSFQGATIGGVYLGAFSSSIDNTILLTGLRLGWFALAAFGMVVLLIVVSALNPLRTSPASIAVAAAAPGLFAVALITQYGMYFWFLAGLAVAWEAERRQRLLGFADLHPEPGSGGRDL